MMYGTLCQYILYVMFFKKKVFFFLQPSSCLFIALFLLVLPLESLAHGLFHELGNSLGGTCVGYGVVIPTNYCRYSFENRNIFQFLTLYLCIYAVKQTKCIQTGLLTPVYFTVILFNLFTLSQPRWSAHPAAPGTRAGA